MPNLESNNKDIKIDLFKILELLWTKKIIVISCTLLFTFLAGLYSFFLPNVYKSETVVFADSGISSISQLKNQYAGIASLTGISIPASNEVNKTEMGIEILESYSFFVDFIQDNDLFLPLIASKGWNKELDKIIFDENIYNTSEEKWVSDIRFSVNGKPTLQYAHRKFLSEHLSISKNRETGFITIGFKHNSPNVAKKFIELLVKDINETIKTKDVLEAKKAIKYLEKEIVGTSLTEVKSGLNSLIQSQIETIMLSNSTDEYHFKTLSHPIAPEVIYSPQRALIIFYSFIFGIFFSTLLVVTKDIFFNKNSKAF